MKKPEHIYSEFVESGDITILYEISDILKSRPMQDSLFCESESAIIGTLKELYMNFLKTNNFESMEKAEWIVDYAYSCMYRSILETLDLLRECNKVAGDTYDVHDVTLKTIKALGAIDVSLLKIAKDKLFDVSAENIKNILNYY